MHMMTNIFGDKNFLSLLCYLDYLIVFGSDEKTALDRLEMVFGRLHTYNLKLAPKKKSTDEEISEVPWAYD